MHVSNRTLSKHVYAAGAAILTGVACVKDATFFSSLSSEVWGQRLLIVLAVGAILWNTQLLPGFIESVARRKFLKAGGQLFFWCCISAISTFGIFATTYQEWRGTGADTRKASSAYGVASEAYKTAKADLKAAKELPYYTDSQACAKPSGTAQVNGCKRVRELEATISRNEGVVAAGEPEAASAGIAQIAKLSGSDEGTVTMVAAIIIALIIQGGSSFGWLFALEGPAPMVVEPVKSRRKVVDIENDEGAAEALRKLNERDKRSKARAKKLREQEKAFKEAGKLATGEGASSNITRLGPMAKRVQA